MQGNGFDYFKALFSVLLIQSDGNTLSGETVTGRIIIPGTFGPRIINFTN